MSVPYNAYNLNLIKHLYSKGYLFNYKLFYNKIILELNIYENELLLTNFYFYKASQGNRYITYKQLKRLIFKKHKKLLLSTNKGVLFSDIALRYKIGGCILVEYN